MGSPALFHRLQMLVTLFSIFFLSTRGGFVFLNVHALFASPLLSLDRRVLDFWSPFPLVTVDGAHVLVKALFLADSFVFSPCDDPPHLNCRSCPLYSYFTASFLYGHLHGQACPSPPAPHSFLVLFFFFYSGCPPTVNILCIPFG